MKTEFDPSFAEDNWALSKIAVDTHRENPTTPEALKEATIKMLEATLADLRDGHIEIVALTISGPVKEGPRKGKMKSLQWLMCEDKHMPTAVGCLRELTMEAANSLRELVARRVIEQLIFGSAEKPPGDLN